MRKIPAALVVLGLVTVGLAGCSLPGSPLSDCSRPEVSNPDVMDLITVTGDTEDEPEVELYTPVKAAELGFKDVVTGDGTAITSASQPVVLDVALFSGTTGELIAATPYDGDLSRVGSVGQFANFPGFEDALHCATEGSRVAIALSPDDLGDGVAEQAGLDDGDALVAVIDLRKVYLAAADGQNQFNSGFGLPSVVRAPDGRPGLIIPDGAAPSELTIQTLKKGDGEEVTGEQPVRVHYTGVVWGEDEPFDSTWDGEPASLTLDAVVPGFAKALEGQTVGSQVLVVVPPDQGYGDQAQGGIPADSTLVFVIDILGVDAVPSE
ncbi:FKBP-type peptidyl-prolyl cis-trans isomerase [Microbacterium trichothecenolyticum]|uniref:peptidylprolyl isomerase n=1 Tax=Microbacterium ureisolvens TaxID=2781186 RepID=A0ABS7HUB9_9MICO|nr:MULTISPECIES: FKBP-type peptidyl-prolyl cis-trans isomerase [Microbacterium]MBW9108715.1 FKBP-type peptidyl-prolyl cis-trans isomerase [Microbacterium ureisolvens]MBW9119092.1 FKBP-type peptidyl-prolyl cis-trans isomerase [Microbacterium trichothecenolyticum]